MRHLITGAIWYVLSPLVVCFASPLGPEPELPDRMFFKAAWRGRGEAGSS